MAKKQDKTKTGWEADERSNDPGSKIIIRGARTHNLKNIDVEMPRGKMIAITGPSGSGKSSLAFDTIFAPVVVGRKGEYYQLLYDLLGKGYEAVKIDGQIKQLREKIELTKTKRHDIDVLIDEIYVSEFTDDPKGSHERLSEAVERALHESNGLVKIESPDGAVRTLSAKFIC